MNTLVCAKISALFFYRRIFCVTKRDYFNYTIIATLVGLFAWTIAFDILSMLQCRSHFTAFWNGDFEVYCVEVNREWAMGLAYSDFLLDLWVLLLPVPRVSSIE